MSSFAEVPELREGEVGGAIWHALKRLWFYIRRNIAFYAFCLVMILGYNIGFVAMPLFVGFVIEAAVKDLGREAITYRSAGLLAVVLLSAVTRYFSRTLVFNAAREVEYEIRNDLFAHLQRLPQSFYFDWRTGDLMSRCVNDLNSVRMLLGPALLQVLQFPFQFFGVLAAMFWLDQKLALLVLLPYPAFVVVARAFGRSLHTRTLGVQIGLADLTNQVQEAVSGIAVVKAYAMEDEQERRFADASQELYRRWLSLVRVNGAMPAITGMLPAIAMFVVLLVGGQAIEQGRLEIHVFFTFTMYIYQLTFPTFIMGWVVALVQRGATAMQRLDEILSTQPSIADGPDVRSVEHVSGEIEFRNLSFRYDAEREWALRDIDLRIPAGSTLGVVGPVGSGKTTLASLIPRIFEVPRGTLFLDGVDINEIPLVALRRSIAMVPQDSFLFSISLADNIAYGLAATEQSQVELAARRAQLTNDVAELPDGYATMVGERGVMLSGGQRQRTALARALALRPDILILDDTLSSVDAATEAAIQTELREVFAGRTVVVVANRVSSVQECDLIAVLDAGRIVERGTHAQLMAARGLYARLAREQERRSRSRAREQMV